MFRIHLLLVLLLAGVVPAAPLAAQGPSATGAIRGRVDDPHGLPVAHARLVARSVLSGAATNADTAPDGAFLLAALAPGSYALEVSVEGFAIEPRRVEVAAGETVDAGTLRLAVAGAREQVIVSASRVEESQADAPTKVLVVTKEDIRQTGYERVGDVLAEVPGVITRAQAYGVGLVAGEQIDGMDSKDTSVLLDGLPFVGGRGINEGYIDLNQQNVGRLERVEVVKGAASALYGTDALGGVINLISRDPSDPLDADVTLSGGSLDAFDARGGVGGRWKAWSGYADLEHHQRDAYSLIPDNPSTVGPNESRQDYLAKLRYGFTPRAALSFTSNGYDNDLRGRSTTAGVDPANPSNFTATPTVLRSNDSTRTYALVGDFLPAPSTTLRARAYSSSYDETSNSRLIQDGGEGPAFDLGTLRETYRRFDVTLGQQWGRRQFLQAGYEGVRDTYRGDNRLVGGDSGQSLTTHDLWIQDRIAPVSSVVLTLGARYQHNSSYGGHAVPKAGVVYRLNDHVTLRSAAGLGFRAPNLGELYYHLLHLEYGYQVIGNPTLEPETSRSYSGGGTFTAGRYQVSVNAFRNDLRNLINYALVCDATGGQDCSGAALNRLMSSYGVPASFDYDDTGASFFTFLNLNVDRAMTQGMDVDGRVTLGPAFTLSGAYGYLDAKSTTTDSPLPYRSRHQGHVKLQYARPEWGLVANVRGTFLGRWPLGSDEGAATADYAYGYQVWSAYASKTLGRGLRAFVAVDNLGDSRDRKLTETPASFDRPDYGRTARVGVSYVFARR